MAALSNIHIFGSGGFALCCVDALLSRSYSEFTIVSNGYAIAELSPYPQVNEEKLDWNQVRYAFVAIGDNFKRHRMVETIRKNSPQVKFASCVHSNALIGTSSKMGSGVYLGAGVVIGPGTLVGDFCVFNNSVTVEHNCQIGDFVNIGTGSHLAGTVNLKSRAILGVGTNILNNLTIGEDALVASGACVTNNVGNNEIVMGLPARIVKSRSFGDSFL